MTSKLVPLVADNRSMQTTLLPTDLRENALSRLRHGRLIITIKSLNSGEHITLRIHGKNRAIKSRYVNLADAKIVAIDSGRLAVKQNAAGEDVQEYTKTGAEGWFFANAFRNPGQHIRVRENTGADPLRLTVARRIVDWLNGHCELWANCEIQLSSHCARCGRRVSDPISIERGVGPECYGKVTGSQHVARVAS